MTPQGSWERLGRPQTACSHPEVQTRYPEDTVPTEESWLGVQILYDAASPLDEVANIAGLYVT